jgi:hypothetical protein
MNNVATTTSPTGVEISYSLKPLPANSRRLCDYDLTGDKREHRGERVPCPEHAVYELIFHDAAPDCICNPVVCAAHGKPETWRW